MDCVHRTYMMQTTVMHFDFLWDATKSMYDDETMATFVAQQ